ncbi:MAG: response regulator [Sphingobacteriales bacterium]|nr:MAG: response regulator [Sphingobacteriales bacterium]
MENTEVQILLIEDSLHDAELTIRALRKDNVAKHILHLKDGAIALDYLFGTGEYAGRDLANKPKLILLDLKMPKVSGLEVLEKITEDASMRRIPVVVLTSSKEHPDVERAYQLGANSYIVKPVDFESFRTVVNTLGMYWLLHNQSSL